MYVSVTSGVVSTRYTFSHRVLESMPTRMRASSFESWIAPNGMWIGSARCVLSFCAPSVVVVTAAAAAASAQVRRAAGFGADTAAPVSECAVLPRLMTDSPRVDESVTLLMPFGAHQGVSF